MRNINTDVYSPRESEGSSPGPFLATVVSHQDPSYMGILEVEILRPSGATQSGSEGQIHQVKYMSPFYGVTKRNDTATDPNANNFTNSQQSYGMWMIPPDVGTTVMVIFIDGDPKRGYWMGCVPSEHMNFMVPGVAATESLVETVTGDNNVPEAHLGRAPTGEYNKLIPENNSPKDPELLKKPLHPLHQLLINQGLSLDDIRGITTSSARRETPSMVFGISTPGPEDKTPSGRRGPKGKAEWLIENAPLSRLGGSSFVMDDGDDKFIRMTTANAGPPEYESIEALPDKQAPSGDPTVPHNELVRIRTRTGHQILLHNSEDLIYIGNAKGTAWIELSSMGKIDIYADDSISVHTKADMNFYADRDINMEAGRNVNIKAAGTKSNGKVHIESKLDTELIVGANLEIKTTGKNNFSSTLATNINSGKNLNLLSKVDTNIKAIGKIIQNASGYYSLPAAGGTSAVSELAAASTAKALTTFDNFYNATGGKITSIMKRIPNHEPWPQHENLDPLFMTYAETDRENTEPIKFTANSNNQLVPKYYNVYTTATDTFTKYKGTTSSDQSGA
jgi:hypothetical protein